MKTYLFTHLLISSQYSLSLFLSPLPLPLPLSLSLPLSCLSRSFPFPPSFLPFSVCSIFKV